MRVFYTGKNRNGSAISKESAERAIPTMFNCPVVCNYDVESDTIGGHDVDFIRKDDGSVAMVNLTNAIGVIPMDAKYWWSTANDNGTTHEYFNVDVLIWKRSPAYSKIKDDGVVSQSMEITVNEGRVDDGVFVIQDFTFTAFCLLGDDVEPCYESASLQLFSKDELTAQFSDMMQELKNTITQAQPQQVAINNSKTEGGKSAMNEKQALMAKFGLTEDMIDFNIEEFSLEELEQKFEALKNAKAKEPDGKFALVGQLVNEIYSALSQKTVETAYGEMPQYFYWDYDNESMEIYCYDYSDWNLYGFKFAMNGDNVVIDFDSKKRMKLAVAEFDEGESPALFSKMVEVYANAAVSKTKADVEAQFQAERTELEEKYSAANQSAEEMKAELEELRTFKADSIAAARSAEEEAVFSQFPDLDGNEDFEALKNDCAKFSIETLEEKCYAIRGRSATKQQTFSMQKPKPTRIAVPKHDPSDDEPYGGIFKEFPPCQ